jgi:hypothetical protein
MILRRFQNLQILHDQSKYIKKLELLWQKM